MIKSEKMASRGYQSRSRTSTPVYDVTRPPSAAGYRNGLPRNNTPPHAFGTKSMTANTSGGNHGPRPGQAICIGEEVRIAIHMALDNFRSSEGQKELEFPSSLNATERAYIHRLAETYGLKSKSRGKSSNRFLTVTKKNSSLAQRRAASFNLEKNTRQHIRSLIQRYPLTNKQRQDLFPKPEKSLGDGKEMMKTAVGRLNTGVPQIPPKRGDSPLAVFQENLPIYRYSADISKILDNNQVVLIAGETGSGKTTQVPQIILDDHHHRNKPCRIFCTQPRRIAALSIADRVAAERGEKVGQTVGYQIRLESKVSPRTLLVFCTTGVLLRTLMGGESALNTVTHIIVDEIHERDRFTDFLLMSLRDILPRFKNIKLILMSAALNTELFTEYFNKCPIVHIPGTMFDVHEYFLEDILKWTNFSTKAMDKYKKELVKLEKQQQQLSNWCNQKLILTDGANDPGKWTKKLDRDKNLEELEPGEEKEELEPWLAKEMDRLLSEAWLTGSEDAFEHIFHLIINENVSVDYMHSETSATALMIATGRGYFDIVERLLNLGANINIRASNDWTVIDWAKKFERVEILELLESYRNSVEENFTSESALVKMSENMSPQDRELLNIYHHCFDDDKVDKDLIVCLLHKIINTTTEGGILIFLPGYDDIVAIRDKIAEDKRFENARYVLFTLHSCMQSTDQRKVFKVPPAGIRKIILSTNIAETSITINDVVYVIDSGKMKEKTFDALSSIVMLKTNWISKANSIQRKGRAGRVQPGVCYHLFSRIRFDNLEKYQAPEMLRLPLHELCLQTKLLASVHVSITEFISKAPQAPGFLIIRNAVQLLKQIDALDPWEDLTEMGHHLADLPVAPSYAKMVLYAVVLKCLDPVLTIVCSLANKDPFVLPAQPCQKRAAALSRKNFAANTFSDHMALLRAFQAWQKARTEGWEKAFCEKNFLSSASMEMIVGMRAQLLGQLRASGFVRARGGGDIRDLNVNSEKWCIVKAALCAGLYPNIIRVDRAVGQLSAAKETKVRIHNLSVLSPNPSAGSRNKNISYLPSEWIVYEEMSRNNRLASVRCCTMVSPITVALFAGPAKLSPEIIKEAEGNISADERKIQDFAGINVSDNGSDSGGEDSEDSKKSCFQLDEWLSFHIEPECATLTLQLRQKWYSLFIRRMRAPSKPWTQVDEAIVRTVVEVLMTEERELGLQQPTGIGQRPRPMSIESIMSCSGGRNYHEMEDPIEEKAKMIKRSGPSTPPKKKDSGKFRAENNPSGSNSNNSNYHMGGNSHSSTPCDSPQPSSPSKLTEKDPGATSSHPCRMFIFKCNNQKSLDISINKAIWATTANNEKKLNKAFLDGKTVYMIFSVQGSGCFQGYAKMSSVISKDKGHEFPSPGNCGACNIEWLKRGNIPFQNTQHLSNPWNDNKKIHVSRDCQEIEPFVGECLLKLWDKPGGNQKRPITRGTLDCSNAINKALYTQASNSSVSLAGGLNGSRNPAAYNRIQADIFANAIVNSHVVAAKGGPGAKQQSPGGHNANMNSSSKQSGKGAHFHYRQNNQFPYQGGMPTPPPSNAGHFLGAHNIYPTAPNMIGAAGMNPMYITPMMANQSPHMSNPGGLSPRHGMSPVVILQRGSNNNQNASNNNQSAGINSASSSMFSNS